MILPTDAKVARLVKLYEDADVRLQRLVASAVDRGAEGTANYYKRQLAQVRKVLVETQAAAIPVAAELIGESYVHGVSYADEALGLQGGFAGVHRQAVDLLAENMVSKLGDAATTVGRQAEDVFRRVALGDVALGIATGQTRRAVTASMKANLIREGVTAFKDKSGRRWSLQSYTKMVARTTTREAVSQGTANRLLENGHDLVRISTHAHDNDECSDYEGKTFSITGDTDGYDVLDVYPPFHPNCVHVLTPADASFEAFERAVESPLAKDRSKEVNAPPVEVTPPSIDQHYANTVATHDAAQAKHAELLSKKNAANAVYKNALKDPSSSNSLLASAKENLNNRTAELHDHFANVLKPAKAELADAVKNKAIADRAASASSRLRHVRIGNPESPSLAVVPEKVEQAFAEPLRDEAAQRSVEKTARAVPFEEEESVRRYGRSHYVGINDYLRWRARPDFDPSKVHNYEYVKSEAENVSKAIAKQGTISEPVEVWRGIGRYQGRLPIENAEVGGVFEHHSFVSASFDRRVSERNFAHDGDLLQIHVPAGARGLDMNATGLAGHTQEKELIFDSGSKFLIESVEDRPGGGRLIKVRLIP